MLNVPDLGFAARDKENKLKNLLDSLSELYESPEFIASDPISIPHSFTQKPDIEIAGLFAALMAWGRRDITIAKCKTLLGLMDDQPHAFVREHSREDLKRFSRFVHRTFQAEDAIFLLGRLQQHYLQHESLETLFVKGMSAHDSDVGKGIAHFHDSIFAGPDVLERCRKHISTPTRNSACKRLNLYLRWMVRSSEKGVDFGIWKSIRADQLVMPLDVHVLNSCVELNLLSQKTNNWKTALLLTDYLKQFDPNDPLRYDYALFGYSLVNKGKFDS